MTASFNKIFPSWILADVTDRAIDFSLPSSRSLFTKEQEQYLSSRWKIDPRRVVNVRQVHGRRLKIVKGAAQGETAAIFLSREIEEADGILTNAACLPIGIRTADCLPIFLWDTRQKCIGLLHAGWRGTQQEIAAAGVQALISTWGCRVADIHAALGPSIRFCCYHVGAEFWSHFPNHVQQRSNHLYFDLVQANKDQLTALGVSAFNIHDSGRCACCNPKYFSYRREGAAAGRMLSMMMIK